jgi:uncharacterized integral membrane protein (TIGR00697 family)
MLKILELFKLQQIEKMDEITHANFNYNYLLGVAMLYMMFMILSGITIYKTVKISLLMIPAGVLVTPFIYSLSNITSEVYGYAVARNMMWWFIFSSTIFTSFSYILINMPSPSNFTNQSSFNLILGSMPYVYFAGIIGSIIGISFNNIIVSKFKIIMEGKRYWLRSIFATAGGEIIYNLIAYPIMFINRVSMHDFSYILICVSFLKVIITAIVWPFECYFASYLKRKEKINIFDYNMKYHIFRFNISHYRKPTLKIIKQS